MARAVPNANYGPTPAAGSAAAPAAGNAPRSAVAAPAAEDAPEQAADDREDRDQQAHASWPRESQADKQHVVHEQPARERGEQRRECRETAPRPVPGVPVPAGPVATGGARPGHGARPAIRTRGESRRVGAACPVTWPTRRG